ncbi:xylan 1,4-beta-xylosidase [Bacillus mesophilus]|uniref:Helix-turn-helix domain-containing protein n=1 Tax=Bacillus mesophilus TaxID=1808955 RepID=A0A6M0Q8Y2_9BACI|nr:helix-turn-helix domain-containing protein [Bacillus mesophilus]MBM7661822.1 xylan 1,4-beta-xylosidase [Bacillus mesophilus]NEY72815.1 helix-turn-helix domain-containing protein [Bacillus mesophilus]
MDTRYQYEQIDYQVDLPVKIFTQTVERFPFHWHEDLELLFVLDGSLEIRVNRDSFNLEEGDLFLVNGNELHFVNSKTTVGKTHVLALQIDHKYVKKHNINLSEKRFYLNSKEMGTKSTYSLSHIKYILANMMDLILNRKNLYHLKIEKLLLELVVILLEHYELPTQTKEKEIDRDHRLLEILKYMNHHCMDSQLSLQEIADEFSLNPQYLSRYFKLNVGESFKKKLDSIRLNKSLFSLRTTDEKITEIALKYGFPDSKAYYRVFKEVVGITPMQYREQYKVDIEKNIPKDYLNINSRESLANLFKHLEKKENRTDENRKDLKVAGEQNQINMKQSKGKVTPTFTKLMTFGYAPHALRRDFTDQLHQIQKEIGFEYVRFHGIFADQLLVYNEKKDGTYYFNFNHIDSLLDNLLQANVKPFIEIGFMPKDLASTEDKIFWWNAYVSPPKEMNRWLALLEAFFKHIINRYGLMEVRTWYFEFWNEPEVRSFWSGTEEEFFNLYEKSYKRVKNIDSEIRLGGFGLMSLAGSWLENFESFMKEKNIHIDFISFHVYNLTHNRKRINKPLPKLDNISVSENPIEQFAEYGSVMLGDEHNLTIKVDQAIQKLKTYHFPDEIWISEWNASINSRDLLHDTCYMGTFIVKNSIQNYWKVSGMGFWTFTDIFEEFQLEQPLFHGGFGLMTYNGIKKAAYHAYYFLSRLGDELIYQEDDIIVTRKGNDYQILLYNYSHPNQLYRSFDYSQLNQTSRYTVFETENIKTHELLLSEVNGNYLLKKQFVNRKQGSSYDAWVDIGAPEHLDTDTMNYLKGKAEPGIHIESVTIEGQYTLHTTLQPHEVQFIEMKQKF